MSKPTEYKFKCLDSDNFDFRIFETSQSTMFRWFWEKTLKRLKKKGTDIDKKFIDKLDKYNVKHSLPDSLKTLLEGRLRRKIRRKLEEIAKRANLVFYEWQLDDIIYEKNKEGNWDIEFIFKGTYARKN